MDALVLVLLFLFFLATSLPIAIAIGLAVIAFTFYFPVGTLSFIPQNMFSAVNSFPLMAIPFFIMTGAVMEVGGLSRRLVATANQLVGNMTAGLAVVTVVACMFFGAISGSAPATVAAIGGIMVPYMVKHNYHKDFAAGLISSAGGLGIIIPPSIPLVIYGVCTTVSIGDLFLAGIGPGFLVGITLIITSLTIGKKRGYKGTGHTFSWKEVGKALAEAKWALFVPIIILGGIYGGIFTPTEAAVVSVIYGIIVGKFVYKELEWKNLLGLYRETMVLCGAIFIIFGTAASLAFLVSFTQLPTKISDALMLISTNKYVILLIINVFLLIVGMVMDVTSANLIFSPLMLAIVKPLGVDPVHFGIIITVNLALGFITPPMAQNIFLASTLTGVSVQAIVRESLPFVLAMIVALMLITFIPEISLWPLQLLRGQF